MEKELKEETKKAIKEAKKKQSKFINEFKEFALRGNVLDLAVGVLIGGAFQNIVASFTKNIISPILGCFGEVNFSEFSLKIGNLNITYGAFITDIINFIIMAFVVFLIVKFMNKLANIGNKNKQEEIKEEKTTKICPYCLGEISVKATRCMHCTSELNQETEKATLIK
jgi:large conductance mechanosensitive channel